MKKIYLLLSLALISLSCSSGQQNPKQNSNDNTLYPIAFYNVENLFDTERDLSIMDEDFTPGGRYKWDNDKYQKKLNNLAYVISRLGKDKSPEGFAILGVAEVENRKVMEDLIDTGDLSGKNYGIVHEDSPDGRGIDVGLIYNPQIFTVTNHKIYPYTLIGGTPYKTRDILVVSGTLAGEPVSILVNHWPSRRGEDSEPLRERAASICKHISDSIYKADPQTGIIIMGDMNDDPEDKSTRIALGAKKLESEVQEGGLFNTMWQLHESGLGSLQYRGKWNLFDQIIISQSLLDKGKSKLNFIEAGIYNEDYLIQQSGNYQGYPLRTFSGNTFLNGYSDHFPTLIYLGKNKNTK